MVYDGLYYIFFVVIGGLVIWIIIILGWYRYERIGLCIEELKICDDEILLVLYLMGWWFVGKGL